ncbi:hypothetical protein GCM10010971_25310 [Silvimonas amylolytica]|uniref:Uncharacterized protein n=1 Tax=Silvimonas amylolytica TaxID=449663 RepID=A0ABQ2PM75_9NEIS|nr:hypothetical protein GCM10010971_25310 [Silvimonas amylolytica]
MTGAQGQAKLLLKGGDDGITIVCSTADERDRAATEYEHTAAGTFNNPGNPTV